ncbi:DUF6878 family protein [Sphingorhabdus lacus]|uniref:DUF6878 domain-containing protein n=1 Tax=Sphingorhabdus lacus TaxID=392610 RepID=A0A6I6L4Y0_9SPHN|nr:DUF6878 family protein [Sphingorhabdus lacus]QGY80789.1 hypothetical protein EUU25_09255 [Sphingorhabdus lacus]
MNDFSQLAANYLAGQAERSAIADQEIVAMKAVLLPQLAAHGILTVEIRFDGYGDSGAIEEISFFGANGKVMECPDVDVACKGKDAVKLASLLEDFAYEALERHHGGWEINEGAFGELLIDVADASFQLDCNLRFISHDSHSTEL